MCIKMDVEVVVSVEPMEIKSRFLTRVYSTFDNTMDHVDTRGEPRRV